MRHVSKRSKWMIFSSLALSVALIVTVLQYFSAVNKGERATDTEFWFIIGMIVLAVISFAAVLIVRLRRGRYTRLLNAEYYAAYENVSDALNTSVLGITERREIRHDILGMLMEGQETGRSVSDVVGSDTKAFVDNVKASFGYRSGFVFNLMSSLQYGVLLVTFIQLILYFEYLGEKSFFEAEIGFSLLVMFVPLAFVIYPLIKHLVRKGSVWAYIIPILYGVGFIGLLILLDNTAYHVPWVRYFLDTDTRMIFSWWFAVILAVLVIFAQGVKWMLRRRSLRRL